MGKKDQVLFTTQEIDILVDALDEWENKGAMGELMHSMLGGMMACSDEEREEFFAEREEAAKAREREKKQRREQSILLKAKLIRLRDKAEVEELEL